MTSRVWTVALAVVGSLALSASLHAGTVTFAEYDTGGTLDIALSGEPAGLPTGVTATWTGFSVKSVPGDTPMSIYPAATLADVDDSAIAFSASVVVSSINIWDTGWGDPFKIIGRLGGAEVWRYDSPGDGNWMKITAGTGKAIDGLVFEGRWNHIDDIVVEQGIVDTDGDGLPDSWEYGYFPGDLTKLGAPPLDFDADGLTDLTEFNRGTNPTLADTDADGLNDNVETDTGIYVSLTDTGSDPLLPDTDSDGRTDSTEVTVPPLTNPNVADTDADGLNDGSEVANGTNPLVQELISWFRAANNGSIVVAGTPTSLVWRVATNAGVVIDQGVGDVTGLNDAAGNGTVDVTPAATTTYTMTSTNATGTNTATVQIIVLPTGYAHITFMEVTGGGLLPSLFHYGAPAGLDLTWVNFEQTTVGIGTPETSGSVFPGGDVPGGDDATLTFSTPASVERFDLGDTSWGSPVTVIGRLSGSDVWTYTSPGDGDYSVTNGAGILIDTLVMEGRWNYYDNFRIALPGAATHPDIRIASSQIVGGQFQLSWNSVAGWAYQVLRKNSLDESWTLATTLPSAGATTSYSEPVGAGSAFYKVMRVP
jgi:hypothetical protein